MKILRKSAKSTEFSEFVTEQMALFGAITIKAMFGGFGIYRDGLIFAIIVDDKLYFKVDAASIEDFKHLGLLPFTYEARGKQVSMSYYEAPAEVLEDRHEMAIWAKKAYQSALKARKPVRS